MCHSWISQCTYVQVINFNYKTNTMFKSLITCQNMHINSIIKHNVLSNFDSFWKYDWIFVSMTINAFLRVVSSQVAFASHSSVSLAHSSTAEYKNSQLRHESTMFLFKNGFRYSSFQIFERSFIGKSFYSGKFFRIELTYDWHFTLHIYVPWHCSWL